MNDFSIILGPIPHLTKKTSHFVEPTHWIISRSMRCAIALEHADDGLDIVVQVENTPAGERLGRRPKAELFELFRFWWDKTKGPYEEPNRAIYIRARERLLAWIPEIPDYYGLTAERLYWIADDKYRHFFCKGE